MFPFPTPVERSAERWVDVGRREHQFIHGNRPQPVANPVQSVELSVNKNGAQLSVNGQNMNPVLKSIADNHPIVMAIPEFHYEFNPRGKMGRQEKPDTFCPVCHTMFNGNVCPNCGWWNRQ